jgi:ubiquinone/menaquinone biosynthesis C-methylase UbiE
VTQERVREVFDDWAERGRAEGMESGHGFSARAGFDRLRLEPGTHYLDIGCGNGYTVRWASAVVGEHGQAVGLDLSPNMIALARQKSVRRDNVLFREAAFPEHTLPRSSFRGIFSMEVLYYLPDLKSAMEEIGRLLEPGGRFVSVVDYYRENAESHTWPDELGVPMTLLSMAGWTSAFEAGGLEVIEQQCVLHPLEPGAQPSWKHTQGSLLTVGEKPRSA